jgi:hypothetical protein
LHNTISWKYRKFEELNLPATTASQTETKRENRDYVQQFDTKYETEDQTIRSDTTLNSENEN